MHIAGEFFLTVFIFLKFIDVIHIFLFMQIKKKKTYISNSDEKAEDVIKSVKFNLK